MPNIAVDAKLIMDMDKRVETAAKMPRTLIEASLPPPLLKALYKVSDSLSIPWVGVLIGLIGLADSVRHELRNDRFREQRLVGTANILWFKPLYF